MLLSCIYSIQKPGHHTFTYNLSFGISYADMDILVFGIQDDSDLVVTGDVYVCMESVGVEGPVDGHHPDLVTQAIDNGAVAVIAEEGNLLGGVPETVPVLYVPDAQEFSQRLADVFYCKWECWYSLYTKLTEGQVGAI
jgi:UDP-N-acetylmuramyl tripeptide synthase